MDSSNPSASLWPADRGGGKAVRVAKALLCQLIDPGRIGVGVTVAADPLHIVIFGCDPEQVRFLYSNGVRAEQDSRHTKTGSRAKNHIDRMQSRETPDKHPYCRLR